MESDYRRRGGWVVALATVLLAAFVGYFAYNAGVSHGVVAGQQISAGGAAAAVPPGVPPAYWYGYGYGWHRPWGFGFFGPFLFFAFWFLILRGLFWGGPWRRYRCYGGRYGYYDPPPTFDDWHRRAHERMTKEPGAPPTDDDRSRR
jgi:hypothetical protein